VVLFATLCVGLAAGAGVAHANDDVAHRRDRNQSVRDRPKPEYEPPGAPVGAFRLYPEIAITSYYDDNIYASDSDEEWDFVGGVAARAELKSGWSTHALNFSAALDTTAHREHRREDTTDWVLEVDGRVDVIRDFYINAAASYGELHEARADSPTDSELVRPVEYANAAANVEVIRRLNRLQVSARARYTQFDYSDGALVGGGTVDEDDRDRAIVEFGARLDAAISADAAGFAAVTGNSRDYDAEGSLVEVDRDSLGFETLVGIRFDLTHLMRGEVGVGYVDQDYDDDRLSSVSGLSTRSRVEWFVDPLVTVTFAVARQLEDAGVANAGGYLSDSVGLSIDYEWRRNVVLGAGIDHSRDDYVGIDRNDERQRVSGRIEYLLNRRAIVEVEASHSTRESSGSDSGREFEVDRVGVTLRLRR
jgi:hypothetical protein